MPASAGALPRRERQVLHFADADAAENRNALGLHKGIVGGRLLLELAVAGFAGAGRLVPVGLVLFMRHANSSGKLFVCSLIWNRVPIFCNPHSFDHIIARSVNRRQPGTERRAEEEPMGWNGSTIHGLVVSLALGAACPPFALAQSPEKNAAVYLYEGGDRAQRLAGRAREEGTLALYTSLATSESVT